MSTAIASWGSGAQFKRKVRDDHERSESSRRQCLNALLKCTKELRKGISASQLPSRNQQCRAPSTLYAALADCQAQNALRAKDGLVQLNAWHMVADAAAAIFSLRAKVALKLLAFGKLQCICWTCFRNR
jgi:hypothetical protein